MVIAPALSERTHCVTVLPVPMYTVVPAVTRPATWLLVVMLT